jgi:hypothetical protein
MRTAKWLALIVAGAVALALFRVALVPILQCPDEDSHFDYAVSIYSNGGLLQASQPPRSGWNTHFQAVSYDWERISHLWTLHLSAATNRYPIQLMESNKVAPDYGSLGFFAQIDQTAPTAPVDPKGLTPKDNPWLVGGYPFGYYALLAVVTFLVHSFSAGGLVETFFALRTVSVLLLAGSIPVFYLLCREMRIGERWAVGATAVFAFHPLTTSISACIQPDNLSLFLSLLAWYFGARSLRTTTPVILIALALSLAALAATKIHFFICVAAPVLLTLLVHRRVSILGGALMMIPTAFICGIERWVSWGKFQVLGAHVPRSDNFLFGALAAVRDYWFGGGAFLSYWSTTYAWRHMPLEIEAALYVGTAITFFAVVTFLARSAIRLTRVARSRPRVALALAVQNAPVVGYILFTLIMIGLYAYTANGFYAQGRHFYPFAPIGFLLATFYAPRLVGMHYRPAIARSVTALLLLFCLFSAFHLSWNTWLRYYPIQPGKLPEPFNTIRGFM